MTTRQEIITGLGAVPEIKPLEEFEQRATFLASYLAHTGLKGFVLGISGGQDSLLAGLIAQRAVTIQRQAGNNASFHAVLLPYGEQRDKDDALLACDVIKPDHIHDINIKEPTDAMMDVFANAGETMADFHKGNVKARMRMIAQYALAGKYNLLVLGTDHAAEAVTGFFTKFGDGGADVTPLSGLSKRQGRQILAALEVPELFITKRPTADLLDAVPGQADEDELALTYDEIDDYLEGRDVDPQVASRIESLYNRTWHKRTVPVTYMAPPVSDTIHPESTT